MSFNTRFATLVAALVFSAPALAGDDMTTAPSPVPVEGVPDNAVEAEKPWTKEEIDAVLDAVFQIEVDSFGNMLDVVEASTKAKDVKLPKEGQTQLDTARSSWNTAKTEYAAGEKAKAATDLKAGMESFAQIMPAWAKKAPSTEVAKVATALTDAVSGHIEKISPYMKDAPEELVTHYNSAKALHESAVAMRATDPKGAFEKEREAMRELDQIAMRAGKRHAN